jgi:hypothetical protein
MLPLERALSRLKNNYFGTKIEHMTADRNTKHKMMLASHSLMV